MDQTTQATLCWHCSKSYDNAEAECTHCGAINGNHNPERAQAQAQLLGMSDDAEPMAVYRMVGGL